MSTFTRIGNVIAHGLASTVITIGSIGVALPLAVNAQATALDTVEAPATKRATEPLSTEQLEQVREALGIDGNADEPFKLSVSGQVNRGVLFYDDGEDTGAIHVDNDNSSTRLRVLGDSTADEGIRVGTVIEVQFESNSTASVDQENRRNAGTDSFTQRKLEAFVVVPGVGSLTVGQGDTASNGTSERDLSATGVIGYSGVADLAGGLRFRVRNDGELTERTIGNSFSNLDGLSRDDRLRYDTPSIAGLTGSVSVIADERWDVAVRHEADFGGIETVAALSWADGGEDELDDRVNGSASALFDGGISVTLAGGRDRRDDRDPSFGYLKLGYQSALFAFGGTAISVDVYRGEDIDAAGDESDSVGFQLVQQFDRYSTDLYAGIRNYSLSASDGTDFDDVLATLVGARIKF